MDLTFPEKLSFEEQLHLEAVAAVGRSRACNKTKYASRQEAQRAADRTNWRNERSKKYKGHVTGPYPCPFCKRWHIGGELSRDGIHHLIGWRE